MPSSGPSPEPPAPPRGQSSPAAPQPRAKGSAGLRGEGAAAGHGQGAAPGWKLGGLSTRVALEPLSGFGGAPQGRGVSAHTDQGRAGLAGPAGINPSPVPGCSSPQPILALPKVSTLSAQLSDPSCGLPSLSCHLLHLLTHFPLV